MRINELLVEEQLDEISLSGIGKGLGNFAKGAANAVGGVAGGIAAIPGQIKQGYKAGNAYVSGQAQPDTPNSQTTATPSATGTPPASGATPPANATPSATGTPPASGAAPADDTADKGFGFDGNTGKPFENQAERDSWFKANNKVDPKAATTAPASQSPEEIRKAKQTAAAQTAQSQMATNPAPTTPPPTTGGAPANTAAPAGKVGVPAGKAAVDQAVNVVQSVRSDRRQNVVQYAKDKIDALQKAPVAPAATPLANPTESIDRILYLTRMLNQAK